ncbi:Dihydrofolate reductase [Catalinimonas alkaloidigena]|uniref:Dihydrofolate reductase n=1 Tax=Catalinimonas alkaloidigena TaxID=1075417 RepID=A0A1G9AWU1_9BACT|nr:dihydrofolate reductase family protein [Catalinimonas alkaloidigena]SDK31816.1 Dihydrofolate reductase [Catalinimonas alkaloidigena]
MKTQYYTATSINGYIADGNHSLEWLFQFGEIDSMKDHYPQFFGNVGAMAMGSTTYEWVYAYENLREHPEKWSYNVPTWVFSRRELPTVPGADIRFVQGDVTPIHAEMVRAAQGKNVWIVGGGDLAGQFHDQGLLDELIISIASVMLDGGAPLLPRRITTPPLQLIDVQQHGSAFAILTYAVSKTA